MLEDAERWRWLSEHIQVAWNEGKFTSLVRIVSEQHRQSLNASVDRMMAGDWSDADRASRDPADSVLEDAARYRWLRERSSTMFVNISINGEGAEIAETLDSAVDAARKQGANHD